MTATFDIIKDSEAPQSRRGRFHPLVYEPLLKQLGPGAVGRFVPAGKGKNTAMALRSALAVSAKKAGIPITTWIVDGAVYCKLKAQP